MLSNKSNNSFKDLGLSKPILDALETQGYTTPTPIQAQSIPPILMKHDLMGAAQTGTGKTAGFTLPLLQRLDGGKKPAAREIRALILTPTRELAAQVGESVSNYGRNLRLSSLVIFGGVNINPQITKLRSGVDILIATPGRLLDLYGHKAIEFSKLEILVLDEADRMLDMGFIHDIKRILKILPPKRQNLMFSATFSDNIRSLARGIVEKPVEVSVSPANTTTDLVTQWICPVDKDRKAALLTHLIKTGDFKQTLVFCRTKHGANKIVRILEKDGITAQAIHGNKSQNARTKALADFKSATIQILVATDIAARGIDIDSLSKVINYDLPNVPESYVHRIGRTGRAGGTGEAISLVAADEVKQLAQIENLIKQKLTRKIVEGFEPENNVPLTASKPARSKPGQRPTTKAKRPSRRRRRKGSSA